MANLKTIAAALKHLNNGDSDKLTPAQQKTLEGENPEIVQHKSGAFIMSKETHEECTQKIETGASPSAVKAFEIATNALNEAKEKVASEKVVSEKVASTNPKMTPEAYQEKFKLLNAVLLAANGDGPKVSKADYNSVKDCLQKVNGVTILTKEAAAEVRLGQRFESNLKEKNAKMCYDTASNYLNKVLEIQKAAAPKAAAPKAAAPKAADPKAAAPKVNIKEVADALKSVLGNNEISNDTKEQYFKTDDKGEITGLNKDTYMTCVNAASSKRKDSEEKTIATGVVSIAKKAFLPKTPEKTGPEMV